MALQTINCIKWIILNFHHFLANWSKIYWSTAHFT